MSIYTAASLVWSMDLGHVVQAEFGSLLSEYLV
jgi:hypothetical protein